MVSWQGIWSVPDFGKAQNLLKVGVRAINIPMIAVGNKRVSGNQVFDNQTVKISPETERRHISVADKSGFTDLSFGSLNSR